MERVRVAWRPRLRFLRNRSWAQAARGWAAMVETSSPSRCHNARWLGILHLSSSRRNFGVQFLEPVQHDVDLSGDGARIGAQD